MDWTEYLIVTTLGTLILAVLAVVAWVALRPWLIELFIEGNSLWRR